jgi:hypothetical protein
MATDFTLPEREGPAPEVGQQPPQLQHSDLGPDTIRASLKEWAFSAFPNVSEHDTEISVPTTRALWLNEDVPAAHDDAFMPTPGSREFAHIHADGSLHLVVDVAIEQEILNKKWGIRHMYYDRGVKEMLVYSPRDEDEMKTVKRIMIESYRYATGDVETQFDA